MPFRVIPVLKPKKMKNLIFLLCLFLLVSCGKKETLISSKADYDRFLVKGDENLEKIQTDISFWSKRLDKDSTRITVLNKLASEYTNDFKLTGNIKSLKNAEKSLLKASIMTAIGKNSALRALAHNYITQHKFKEAETLLAQAYDNRKERATALMLFDVHMELGNYDKAKAFLDKVMNFKNFDYLIRLSKWVDYKGDLQSAIRYLEKATAIAEKGSLRSKMNWAYSNLADYYGHAGEIQKSYTYYLKALELNKNDTYALQKLAWILFSHEKKIKEAKQILSFIKSENLSPDIYLMLVRIAEYERKDIAKKSLIKVYLDMINIPEYGDMYNKYTSLFYAEENATTSEAIAIAQKEVANRPTPQSYDLLGWAYFNSGDPEKALSVFESYVSGKTFEPATLYHYAVVLKANNKNKEKEKIKSELLESLFELGPDYVEKIAQL